jgi:hypothetical protein
MDVEMLFFLFSREKDFLWQTYFWKYQVKKEEEPFFDQEILLSILIQEPRLELFFQMGNKDLIFQIWSSQSDGRSKEAGSNTEVQGKHSFVSRGSSSPPDICQSSNFRMNI